MISVMRLVAQQRLERTEADDLVGDLLEHALALGAREGEALGVERAAEGVLDLAPNLDLVGQVELGVEVGDDALLDAELGVAERLAQRYLGEHSPAAPVAAGVTRACGGAGVPPSWRGGGGSGHAAGRRRRPRPARRPGAFDPSQAVTC